MRCSGIGRRRRFRFDFGEHRTRSKKKIPPHWRWTISNFKFQNFKIRPARPARRKNSHDQRRSQFTLSPGSGLLSRADREARRFERRGLPSRPCPGPVGLGIAEQNYSRETVDGLDLALARGTRLNARQKISSPRQRIAARAMQRRCRLTCWPETEAGKIYPRVVEWTRWMSAAVTLGSTWSLALALKIPHHSAPP